MDRARGDLGVERGRLELAVPEQDLDDADVDVLFEQVRRKTMPQRVRMPAASAASQTARWSCRVEIGSV